MQKSTLIEHNGESSMILSVLEKTYVSRVTINTERLPSLLRDSKLKAFARIFHYYCPHLNSRLRGNVDRLLLAE